MEDHPPNVLWIVWDTCRADFALTEYDGVQTTPNLAALAEDAVTYTNAFSAAPWTPPSHASMFSGLHPSTHGYLDDGMPFDAEHVAERLSGAGYETVSVASPSKIGAHTPLGAAFDTVYDLFRFPVSPASLAEFQTYYGSIWREWLSFLSNYARDRARGGSLATAYLEHHVAACAGERPLFAFANYLSPHSKYDPPAPFRARFDSGVTPSDPALVDSLADRGGYRYISGEVSPTEADWTCVKDRYAGEIAYADSLLGRLIRQLKRQGLYDETLVIVTADHGEHFGEHGLAYHQFSLYDELIHVPLVVKFPGQARAGTTVETPVSHVDLFPTVMDVVGLPDTQSVGHSLLSPEERPAFVFAEYGRPTTALNALENYSETPVPRERLDELDRSLQCVRSADAKLILDSTGRWRAYDLTTDPGEQVNVWDPDSDRFAELEAALAANLSELLDVDPEEPEDEVVIRNLEALGYR